MLLKAFLRLTGVKLNLQLSETSYTKLLHFIECLVNYKMFRNQQILFKKHIFANQNLWLHFAKSIKFEVLKIIKNALCKVVETLSIAKDSRKTRFPWLIQRY